ncbi:MAG: hypothetical protein ABI402_08440 [Ferruginibacter sp.]
MKKIFTLMLTVSLATVAFAQYDNRQGNEKNNDVAYNNRRDRQDNDRYKDNNRSNDRHYYFEKREMEKQIADINREYDRKICDVKDNRFMSSFRKQRTINELEDRRNFEIKGVYAKFNGKGQGRHW